MYFRGAFTALVTPFRDGLLDEKAYREHIEWQIDQGIHGLVPCGTTGESATLSHDEHKRVIGVCVDQVKGRVPVLAGAGSNNTFEAVELTRYAKQAGADAALLITPYYNKPTQAGLIAHFKAICAEVDLPFVLYNVPGRTACNMLPETLAVLRRDCPSIVGVKEATGDLVQISNIFEQLDSEFCLLSGDDFTLLPTLALGGAGVISVVSNVAPGKMAGLCDAFFAGDMETAKRLHFELAPLVRAMFYETNPIPAKTALAKMGRINLELRLPLVPMSPANEARLTDALSAAKLI